MIRTLENKKILLIGDVHGRPFWQKAVNKSSYDLVIFMGDYFDPYDRSLQEDMYDNFEKIVAFKEANPDQVLLLIGNHDGHYMGMSKGSRYSPNTAARYSKRLLDMVDRGLFQKACMLEGPEKPVLFTHAGLSRTYFWTVLKKGSVEAKVFWNGTRQAETLPAVPSEDLLKLEEEINNLDIEKFDFNGPSWDYYGEWHGQGPMWIRPLGLTASWIPQIRQVVGHTQLAAAPQWVQVGDDPKALFLCDNGNFYTEIINGNFKVEPYEKDSTNRLL